MEYDGTGSSTLLGTAELPAVELPLPPAGPQGVDLPGYVVIPPALADRLPLPVGTTTLVPAARTIRSPRPRRSGSARRWRPSRRRRP